MIEITQSPPVLSLQGMPFVVAATSDNEAAYFRILAEAVGGQFDILPLDPLNGNAIFDLREYFLPELEVSLNIDTPQIHENACKLFTIKLYEYFGNPPAVQYPTTLDRYVISGKIPKWKHQAFFSGFNSYFAYFSANNIFLTWHLSPNKTVLPDQPEVLYFVSPTATPFYVLIDVKYADETVQQYNSQITIRPQLYQVVSIPVGFNKLGVGSVNPGKKVSSYTVKLGDLGFSRTYTVNHGNFSDTRYLLFKNSLGGYDTLACTGEADESTDIDRTITERVYDAGKPQRLNKKVQKAEETEVIKVNTGWLLPDEKNWLNDLVCSDDVFELAGNILQPVLMKTTSLDRSQRSYEPGSVELEYERLYPVR